jgi:hypothetical protein
MEFGDEGPEGQADGAQRFWCGGENVVDDAGW